MFGNRGGCHGYLRFADDIGNIFAVKKSVLDPVLINHVERYGTHEIAYAGFIIDIDTGTQCRKRTRTIHCAGIEI